MEEHPMARVLSLGGVDARTQFVGRFIGASLFTSTTVGLFCGQVGAFLPCGPLLPFLGGSVAGYAVGAVVFWQREKARALEYADKYPLLLEHAFLSDFGHQARRLGLQQRSPQELGDWVRSGSLGRLTWSIIASQSCKAAVQELQDEQRQKLVEAYKDNTSLLRKEDNTLPVRGEIQDTDNPQFRGSLRTPPLSLSSAVATRNQDDKPAEAVEPMDRV